MRPQLVVHLFAAAVAVAGESPSSASLPPQPRIRTSSRRDDPTGPPIRTPNRTPRRRRQDRSLNSDFPSTLNQEIGTGLGVDYNGDNEILAGGEESDFDFEAGNDFDFNTQVNDEELLSLFGGTSASADYEDDGSLFDDDDAKYGDGMNYGMDDESEEGVGLDDSAFSLNAGNSDDGSDSDVEEEFGQASEKGALYDAYNLLHTLAQDFQKPFDAPAVVVVGHQSCGKSALIEALMGFQFNQVGGGTKTRRPVALRMQYNPRCSHPNCFLQGDDGVERPKSLSEIQAYIESENRKLERDPVRCFDSREINIRMEYKYCPNMILIDTPGLIAAPKLSRHQAGAANHQQRALLSSAREAERLVVSKMKCPDYIILCVEDTSDWKHGATREVVQKADPDLSRTVIVNTKLDTKVPQFGTQGDVADFLRADIIDRLSPHKLGGPFFTSVPSGRVSRREKDSKGDYLYENDDDFVSACAENEESDRAIVWQRLKGYTGAPRSRGRAAASSSDSGDGQATVKTLLPRVGISRLRGFLERRVDECYRRNVAKIVPLLQAEHESAARRLEACEKELESISVERLKAGADTFCEDFCKSVKDAIQGSIVAPPGLFGETLSQENAAAGSFQEIQGCPMAVSERTWDRLVATEVGNRDHRLYGGSQYHRVIREFNLATRCLRLPSITEDEIANAAGVGDTHDGVNFLRASCVIALEKARTSFDPLLESLRIRVTHIMEKICPVSEYMLRQRHERSSSSNKYMNDANRFLGNGEKNDGSMDISQNPQFRELIRTIFDRFVQKCSDSAMARCHDDLAALTRFVTWDLHERSSGALQRSLPDQTDIVAVYQVAVEAAKKAEPNKRGETVSGGSSKSEKADQVSKKGSAASSSSSSALTPITDRTRSDVRDYNNLLQLMEEAACSRDANRTNLVVGGLVQHIVAQWRETFGRSVTTKFNCYFLLPFVDELHRFLRRELQAVYEGEEENLCEVFDLTAARKALQQRQSQLINECAANKRLQEKFDMVSRMMRNQQGLKPQDIQGTTNSGLMEGISSSLPRNIRSGSSARPSTRRR